MYRFDRQTAPAFTFGSRILAATIMAAAVITGTPAVAQTQKARVAPAVADMGLPKLATAVAFPSLKFDRPVALAVPGDGSNLLFVVEQHTALIWSFPDQRATSDKKVLLKLTRPINKGNEEGLLGLAFHPKYKDNKQFFVYYSAIDRGKRRLGRLSIHGLERQPSKGRPWK